MKTTHAALSSAAISLAALLASATTATEAAPALKGFPTGIQVPAGAASGDLSLAPCRYRVEADAKEYDADCGTLVVAENRSKEGSRLIALPLVRIHSLERTTAEPIFWFEGGPGSTNIMSYPTDGLLRRHDFVMVGYRGLDSDAKLTCPEVVEHVASARGSTLSESARANYKKGSALCAERLTRAGVDLGSYSMTETIDDMEAARKALGYERIDIFGNSFGTRLELIYMWRHPHSLHRAVLVGVNPPGHFIWDAHVTDEQLGQYTELCAKDDYCRSRTDDLAKTMRQVSANMPRSWLGIPIDADLVKLATFFSLVETIPSGDSPVPVYGPAAIDMWLDAAEGDASGMALLSVTRNLLLPTVIEHWGHFFAMGSSTIDYYNPRRDYANELMPADTILGAPASMFFWSLTQGWPAGPASHDYNETLPSQVETLLVSGTLDFTNPIRFSRDQLLPKLTKGHQVTLREFGHTETFWHSQPAARAKLLNGFMDDGTVDTTLYVYQPPVFEVERGWDTLAHQLLAMIIVFFLVVVVLSWLLVRFLRRRLLATSRAEASVG